MSEGPTGGPLKTVLSAEKYFDYPHSSPESRVSMMVGVSRCDSFQTVRLDVRVEAPCHPGKELEAGEFCSTKCSQILKANEDDLDGLLASLVAKSS